MKASFRFKLADMILGGELRLAIASAKNNIGHADKCLEIRDIGEEFRTPRRFMKRASSALEDLYYVGK